MPGLSDCLVGKLVCPLRPDSFTAEVPFLCVFIVGLYGIDIGLPISLYSDVNFIQGNCREKENTTMVTLGIYHWYHVVSAEDP